MSIFMYYCPTKFGKYQSSCSMNFYVQIGIHLHSVKRIRKIFHPQPHPHCFEVVRVIFYLFNGVQFNFSLSVYNFELFLFQAANVQQQLTDIKAANQSAQYLGNRVEMAITSAVEKNKALLRVGVHFEYGDCRYICHTITYNQPNACRMQISLPRHDDVIYLFTQIVVYVNRF